MWDALKKIGWGTLIGACAVGAAWEQQEAEREFHNALEIDDLAEADVQMTRAFTAREQVQHFGSYFQKPPRPLEAA